MEKKITLEVVIPKGYKWIARQPYGEWTAYRKKPKVHRAVEHMEGEFIPEYWAVQKDEAVITTFGEHSGDWKKSLRKI